MAPNKIDFDKVFTEITHLPPENMVVLFTVCLIFVVYAVGLVFARRADNRDKLKVGFSQKCECLNPAVCQSLPLHFPHIDLLQSGTQDPLKLTEVSYEIYRQRYDNYF